MARSLRLLVAGVLVSSVALAGSGRLARAATLTVCPSGCMFTTISGAVSAASNGDTISIGAGTYVEANPCNCGGFATNLVIPKALTLIGAGAGSTIIEPANAGPVVVTAGGTVAAGLGISIQRVTITGGFTDANDPVGAGIYNDPGNDISVSSTTISNNSSTGNGGGIASPGGPSCSSPSGSVTVTGSTITGNSAFIGGGLNNGDNGCGFLTIRKSTITNNTGIACGGGIANNGVNHGGSVLSVQNSTISNNQTLPGGPGGCIIYGGAGVWNSGSATLKGDRVSGNTTPAAGGGALNLGDLSLISTVFANNTAQSGGALADTLGGTTTSDKKSVVCDNGNSPNDYPGC